MSDTDVVIEGTDDEDFDKFFASYALGDDEYDDVIDVQDEDEQVIDEPVVVPVEPDSDLKTELARIKKERDDLEHKLKSDAGRVASLQRKLDEATKKPVEHSDEIKTLLDDYPDIAAPIMKMMDDKITTIKNEVDGRFEPIQAADQDRYIKEQLNILDGKFPGWGETVASADYLSWLMDQPEAVFQLSNSSDARDYSFLLDTFNKARPQQSDPNKTKADEIALRRQQKLAANVAIPKQSEGKAVVAPDDFDSAFDYYSRKKK
jgi:hypothetical protein